MIAFIEAKGKQKYIQANALQSGSMINIKPPLRNPKMKV